MNLANQPVFKKIRCFGIIDILLIIVITTSAIAFIPVMQNTGPATVIVRRDNSVIARYPAGRKASFRIRGAEGPLDIRIDTNGATVVKASCRNQVCVQTGRIRRPCQQIICAPNHVVIEIVSTHAADSIDAVTR